MFDISNSSFCSIHTSPYYLIITQCMIIHSLINFAAAPEKLENLIVACLCLCQSTPLALAKLMHLCSAEAKANFLKENKWTEADFQQGCCPLHMKLVEAIWLTSSEKKSQALANNSQSYLILFGGLVLGYFSSSILANQTHKLFCFKTCII